jgi:anti-anti-sigma regulatory factor
MDVLQPLVLALQSDGKAVPPYEWHERFLALYDAPHIVVDTSGLADIQEYFLAELALMRAHRRAAGKLLGRLVVPSKSIRASLEKVGFSKHWPIFETLGEAVASFHGPQIYA